MQQTFEQALEYIKNIPSKPQPGQKELTNQQKLEFYGLFKQATAGDNTTKAPSRLKIAQKMKWDAWKQCAKMSKEEAMKKYVQKLTSLIPSWNGRPKL